MKKADLGSFSDFGFLILKWKNVGREVRTPRDRRGNILIKSSNLFIYRLMVALQAARKHWGTAIQDEAHL